MLTILKNKQILYLFLSGFAVLFTGMGLFPILPLFAAQFEVSNSVIGLYFAIMYAANALGPVFVGWLIVYFSKRTVFIAGGIIGIPSLIFLSMASNLFQVIVLTSLIWFSGGVIMSLISIFTSLHTDIKSRGKAYSLMAMVGPLGSLAGGAVVGRLVSWQGYPVMFLVLAISWSVVPMIGWLFLKEGEPQADRLPVIKRVGSQSSSIMQLGPGFARIMVITFLGSMSINVSRLGTSLSMQAANFSAEAVSGAAMVSGLVAIPLTLVIGALSDKMGRKHFLSTSYLLMMSGAMILLNASNQWQYNLASILSMMAVSVSGAMVQAVTSEVIPAHMLGKGLSVMGVSGSVANILCFAIGGMLFDLFDMQIVFLGAAIMALVSGVAIEGFFHRPKLSSDMQTAGGD